MTKLFNYLLISNIFTSGFVFFKKPFEFFVAYIFMILFLFYYVLTYRKLYMNSTYLLVMIIFTTLSIMNMGWNNASSFLLWKQVYGFLFNGLTYYLLMKINKYQVDKLFRIYLKLALIVGLIAIFQEVSFVIGFKYGYDYSAFIPIFTLGDTVLGMMRITSIFPECTHFGMAMAPAMFVSVLNIIKGENNYLGRKASWLIVISVLLTFSVVVYIGFVIAIILIMLNYRKVRLIVAAAMIIAVFMVVSYQFIPIFKMRIDDTTSVVIGKKQLEKANLSTFAYISNALVTYKSFINNPLFGSGLGGHPVSYDRYIDTIINRDKYSNLPMLCKGDAGSMLFRLISETGIVGGILFLYFLVRFYVSKKRGNHFWIISSAIICLIVLYLARMGNYFYNGFIFFIWLYYFTYKASHVQNSSIRCIIPNSPVEV
jgi:hypothetical protein